MTEFLKQIVPFQFEGETEPLLRLNIDDRLPFLRLADRGNVRDLLEYLVDHRSKVYLGGKALEVGLTGNGTYRDIDLLVVGGDGLVTEEWYKKAGDKHLLDVSNLGSYSCFEVSLPPDVKKNMDNLERRYMSMYIDERFVLNPNVFFGLWQKPIDVSFTTPGRFYGRILDQQEAWRKEHPALERIELAYGKAK